MLELKIIQFICFHSSRIAKKNTSTNSGFKFGVMGRKKGLKQKRDNQRTENVHNQLAHDKAAQKEVCSEANEKKCDL